MNIEPKYAEDAPDDWVELDPFARHNWKTAESRDMWRDPLARAAEAKREAEWRSVMSDETDRKAAIIHVYNSTREKWIKRVGENDLHYRAIRYSQPYEGFAHKFHPTDKTDPNRVTYSVISQNSDVADKMKEAELEMDGTERHDVVGELLGFPDCCREFFGEKWVGERDRGLTDPMYEITCNTPSAEVITDRENLRVTDPDPFTNIMWRYFGWSFITHFPCSWECEKSGEIGRERRKLMYLMGYGDASDMMLRWLEQPFVWDGLHSIANVRNMHATATAGSSSWWSKKRVVWRRKHFPQMKDSYTWEDFAQIEA